MSSSVDEKLPFCFLYTTEEVPRSKIGSMQSFEENEMQQFEEILSILWTKNHLKKRFPNPAFRGGINVLNNKK